MYFYSTVYIDIHKEKKRPAIWQPYLSWKTVNFSIYLKQQLLLNNFQKRPVTSEKGVLSLDFRYIRKRNYVPSRHILQ